jgi:hypothetical protein
LTQCRDRPERRAKALRYDAFESHLAGVGEASPSICSLNRMPGLARRPRSKLEL